LQDISSFEEMGKTENLPADTVQSLKYHFLKQKRTNINLHIFRKHNITNINIQTQTNKIKK